MANLQKDNGNLRDDLSECQSEIKRLKMSVANKEKQLEEQLMEHIHTKEQMRSLRRELDEVWTSYQNDRDWWKQRAEKVLG